MAGRYIEFEPGTKHPKKDPEYSYTPDTFDSCGYEIGGDEVIIDIDGLGKPAIKEMIKRFDIKTQIVWTTRGAHLYYKMPMEFTKAVQGVNPLGFKQEMKTAKNTKAITVKIDGVLRETDNFGVREELPWFFMDRKKYPVDMTGMSENDGRNNSLFSHRMRLGNKPEVRKIIMFINECVFAEPLTDQEVEAIIARPAVDSKLSPSREASSMIAKQYRTVIWQNRIYWYDGSKYNSDADDLTLKQMIMMKYPDQETRFCEEVIRQIRILSDHKGEEQFAIKFNNGFLLDGEFYKSKGYADFTPYYINVDYDPEAEPVSIVDEYLDNVADHDESYRLMLIEAMGYPMVTDVEAIRAIGKFFFFRGNGSNGKGTMLQIMKRIYSPENCTSCSPRELADERYICTLIGKLVNLGDDIEPDAINNKTMRALKNIATADTFEMRELFKQSISGTITAKLFFTTNTEIKTFEKNYAYKRRVMWLPMFNKVERPDPKFISKITSPAALRYWIRLMVEGYQRLMKNGKFTYCERIAEFNEEYHKNNNYMTAFVESVNVETDILGHTGTEVRALWNDYNDDPGKTYNPKLLNDVLEEMGIVCAVTKDPISKKCKRLYVTGESTSQKKKAINS